MSDWKKRNEDWRDEDELEEEEECECPWVDSKGKVRETAYCQYLLENHHLGDGDFQGWAVLYRKAGHGLEGG